jgi:hypothetical protein
MRGRRSIGLLLAGMLLLPATSGARRRRHPHGNPHAEVSAVGRVETAPRRTTHRNGRTFEELDVVLLSVQPFGSADARFSFDTRNAVSVVHDLTCGGSWVELSPGERVELRGEYVHRPSGHDLIHFTHPADGACGASGRHVGGFLRPLAGSASTAAAASQPAGIPEASAAMFRSSLRPILSVRCAPCHEPGGRMYARMPFDDPATVASHAARMATRLSGEERRALEAWAAGLTPPAAR